MMFYSVFLRTERLCELSRVSSRWRNNDQDAFALQREPGQGMVFELRAPKALEIEEFEV